MPPFVPIFMPQRETYKVKFYALKIKKSVNIISIEDQMKIKIWKFAQIHNERPYVMWYLG